MWNQTLLTWRYQWHRNRLLSTSRQPIRTKWGDPRPFWTHKDATSHSEPLMGLTLRARFCKPNPLHPSTYAIICMSFPTIDLIDNLCMVVGQNCESFRHVWDGTMAGHKGPSFYEPNNTEHVGFHKEKKHKPQKKKTDMIFFVASCFCCYCSGDSSCRLAFVVLGFLSRGRSEVWGSPENKVTTDSESNVYHENVR